MIRTATAFVLATVAALAQQPEFTEIATAAGPIRCAIALPDGHDAARCHPTALVLAAAAPDEAAVRRALAGRLAGDFAQHGWLVLCPAIGERPDALPAILAWLRTHHRVERSGVHLVGFDGGGATALAVALAQPFEFASVTAIGDGLPDRTPPLQRLRGKRVRLHTGQGDPARLALCRDSADRLQKAGVDATCTDVAGDASVPDLERTALRTALQALHDATAIAGPTAEVHAVLDEFHDAASRGDEQRYFAILPEDAVFLGTDPGERWTGTAFRAFAMPWFQRESAWIYVPQGRNVTVDADGTVAWFDERLGSAAYGECRGTGVLRRRQGQWQILQYDLTIPVPNDLAGDVVARIRAFTDGQQQDVTTVIVVRHAEKEPKGDDPELTPAGAARAHELAHVLQSLPVAAVFHSQFRRTAATVAPLCEGRSIPTHTIAADATGEVARRIRAEHRGQTVVVAGHSNTVPAILAALGVQEPVAMTEADYDRLYVVTIAAGQVRMLPLRFGAGTAGGR